MKPLIVLLFFFFIALVATKVLTGSWNDAFAGNLGMSVMLLFTSIGHFAFSKGMSMMLPRIIPYKRQWVFFTGLIEIAAAIGLMIPSLRHLAALGLIIFFVLILPANIYAAVNSVDHEKGTLNGKGPAYLWFRVPLQILFITWTWYFSF